MMNEITNLRKPYGDVLKDYLSSASPAYVIAPFINIDVLERLLSPDQDAIIITSWREDHLKSGYSSLQLYEVCLQHGWSLFVNNSLHAKIYSNSMKDCILGSANVTDAALFNKSGNIDCMAYLSDIGASGRIEIYNLLSNSVLVDDRVFSQYQQWFEKIKEQQENTKTIPFVIEDISPFYISQLPATDDPLYLWHCLNNLDNCDYAEEHDLAIFGMLDNPHSKEEFIEKLANNFFKHPFIALFKKRVLEGPIFFGEAKEWVQNNCVNVPSPHRKELTELVHNLFSWFTVLEPKHFQITVPGRHSECLIFQ